MSLGVVAIVVFMTSSQLWWQLTAGSTVAWASWILFLATYLGYDLPSWSPLWRADVKELVLGKRHTHIEIVADKCTGCHLCDVVCPASVFEQDPETRKYFVADLDACQACGACVENCPADAIVTNFRSGICSCPTCTVINRVGVLKATVTAEDQPAAMDPDSGSTCCDDDATSTACGCESYRGEH